MTESLVVQHCYAHVAADGRVEGVSSALAPMLPGLVAALNAVPISPEDFHRAHAGGHWSLIVGTLVPIDPPDLSEGAVRAQRNRLLAATDGKMQPDVPMTETKRAALVAYRQQLRDIPDQPGFPAKVVWPTPP